MAYTVGPGKKKTPPKAKEKEFKQGFFGYVESVVDALNKNTKAKEDIYKKVNNR